MKTRIIFGCNEESGSSCVKYYFQHQPFPKMGFTPDAGFPVVYGEKAGAHYRITGNIDKENIIGIYSGTKVNVVPEVCEAYVVGNYKQNRESFMAFLNENGLEGSVEEEGNHTKLILMGKSAHASTPELGINAATYMCHYLSTISQNKLVHFVNDCFYNDHNGKNLGVGYQGAMGLLTTNLGILNYKDGYVDITVDMRVPHEITEQQLTQPIDECLEKYGLKQTHHLGQALYMDPESPLVKTLHSAYVSFTGDYENQPQTIGGGTYAKSMPNCVAFGSEFPYADNKIHQNNEEFSIDDLVKATAIYAKALYELIKE